MSDELRNQYVAVLIEMLARHSTSDDERASLMDRIERLLGLSGPAPIAAPSPVLPPEARRAMDVLADLDRAFPSAHLLDEPEPVSEPAPNIPFPFLAALDDAPTREALEEGLADVAAGRLVSLPPEPDDAVPAALTGDGDASGAPQLALVGGSEKPATTPLTARQAQVCDAYRAAGGNLKAAATALVTSDQNVRGQLDKLRKAGRLPADLVVLWESGRHYVPKAHPPGKAARQLLDTAAREAETVRHVVARSREREAEASSAADTFVATRQEHARAKADEAWRRNRGES